MRSTCFLLLLAASATCLAQFPNQPLTDQATLSLTGDHQQIGIGSGFSGSINSATVRLGFPNTIPSASYNLRFVICHKADGTFSHFCTYSDPFAESGPPPIIDAIATAPVIQDNQDHDYTFTFSPSLVLNPGNTYEFAYCAKLAGSTSPGCDFPDIPFDAFRSYYTSYSNCPFIASVLNASSCWQVLWNGSAPTLASLAAIQAEKLQHGDYGEGGKGYDYSLAFRDSHGNPFPPADGNSCEIGSAELPCWITPTEIANQSAGYWYFDSNPGYSGSRALDYGLDCSGLIMWSYMTGAGATNQPPISRYEGAGVQGEVIQSIYRKSGVVTVTALSQGDFVKFSPKDKVTIDGVRDSSFNSPRGTYFTIASVSPPNQFTYNQPGPDTTPLPWGVATDLTQEAKLGREGQCSDAQSTLLTNDIGDLSQASTYNAPGNLLPGDIMCFRVYQIDLSSGIRNSHGGHVAMFVGNDAVNNGAFSTIEAYNRTWGVRTGHVNSSSTADLGRALQDPLPLTLPTPIRNCALPSSGANFCFDFLGYRRPTNTQASILIQSHSPISLSVTDPGGFTIDSTSWIVTDHEAYRGAGSLSYNDFSTNGDDFVFSGTLEIGPYTVRAIPKPGAAPDATYSVTVTVGANTTTLAENVPISQIPPLGYGVQSDGTALTPFIPVVVDIKPGTNSDPINPTSKGAIPVAMLSTTQFDAPSEIDPTSLRFGRTGNEASLAFCNVNGQDVNGDGLPDLVCHFYTQKTGFQNGDTLGILTGTTMTGTLIRGTDKLSIVP